MLIRGFDYLNNKSINHYSILKTIGSGSYGKAKLAIVNETGKYFALKIF